MEIDKGDIQTNLIDSQHRALNKLIEAADGSDQVGEIEPCEREQVTAKGAWATGKAIRGPHRHYGVVDEMQDMTRTAWYVLLEVVNLPGRQIIAMGTGGPQGTLWHELWESQIRKNGMARSGLQRIRMQPRGIVVIIYLRNGVRSRHQHLGREEEELSKTLYLTEVECAFFNGAGLKPAPYEATKNLVVTDINETRRLLNSIVTKSIGIDWGNVTAGSFCGMTATNDRCLSGQAVGVIPMKYQSSKDEERSPRLHQRSSESWKQMRGASGST